MGKQINVAARPQHGVAELSPPRPVATAADAIATIATLAATVSSATTLAAAALAAASLSRECLP